ncbi:hypothetical protein ACOMHN_047509 [Nucella lapillus]
MAKSASPFGNQTTATPARKKIGILGTGNFATAFAHRLLASGYSVIFGSRSPQSRREILAWDDVVGDVSVTTLEDCVTSSDVIIVALHVDHYEKIFTPEVSKLCSEKVLVDISNEKGNTADTTKTTSNAQFLASLTPEASIVKAFNCVPAYVMEHDVATGGRRVVPVASDDVSARVAVCALAGEMGFEPEDKGRLSVAGEMEERERRVFPQWTVSVVVMVVVVVFWLVFAVSRFYLADNKLSWNQLPIKVFNKVFGAAALSLLSMTYVPSTCAACVQMYYGTKHRAFPGWLDSWLKMRKQLGLLAFALISLHAVISALIVSPRYMSAWFLQESISTDIPSNLTGERVVVVVVVGSSWMTWIGELSLLVGVLAYVLMVLLAVTSLPSVTKLLHWAEWRCLHSRLGYVMLMLAVMHVYVMGVPKWMKSGFPLVLFRVKFMSIVLPSVVLVCRLVVVSPCVSVHLRRIRQRWGRRPAASRQLV